MAMTLVSTVTVGSGGAASIEFTNIAQTGKDLLILLSGRDTAAVTFIGMQFNGDTASNYTSIALRGDGANAVSTSNPTTSISYIFQGSSGYTANTFSNGQIYVSNYTSSAAKSVSVDAVNENNATTAQAGITAARWTGTAAITSVKINANTNFVQHSTASLYLVS